VHMAKKKLLLSDLEFDACVRCGPCYARFLKHYVALYSAANHAPDSVDKNIEKYLASSLSDRA